MNCSCFLTFEKFFKKVLDIVYTKMYYLRGVRENNIGSHTDLIEIYAYN